MKLTKQRIKEIIKEELEAMNEEPMEEQTLQEGFDRQQLDLRGNQDYRIA